MIIDKANENSKMSLIMPALTLEEFKRYDFQITFENYLGISNTKTAGFITGSTESPYISIRKNI